MWYGLQQISRLSGGNLEAYTMDSSQLLFIALLSVTNRLINQVAMAPGKDDLHNSELHGTVLTTAVSVMTTVSAPTFQQ